MTKNLQYLTDESGEKSAVVIPIEKWRELKNSFEGLEEASEEPTKEEIFASIKQGLKEVELIKQGKMKGTPLNDFLDEL